MSELMLLFCQGMIVYILEDLSVLMARRSPPVMPVMVDVMVEWVLCSLLFLLIISPYMILPKNQ
jgi:hypothetical protein